MKILGIAFAFAIVIVAFLMFPDMTDSIHSADTSEFEETFTSVTTAVGATTTICNLTQPLYNDDIGEVTEITSDNANDFPSALSYDEDQDDLTVKSLAANTTRNITVTYNTDAVGGFVGLNKIFSVTPLLIMMGILAVIGCAVWWGFFRGK